MLVVVQVIGAGIVGHIEIGPAVVVIVRPYPLHSEVMIRIIHSGLLGHVFKSSISAVAKKKVGLARKPPRAALHWNPAEPACLFVASKLWKLVCIDVNVARDK